MNEGIIPVVPFLILWGIILFMKFYASEKSDFLFPTENNVSAKMTWSQVFLENQVLFFSPPPVSELFRAQLLADWCLQCYSRVYVAKSTGSPKEEGLTWAGAGLHQHGDRRPTAHLLPTPVPQPGHWQQMQEDQSS